MRGLMMNWPLTVPSVLEHAAKYHPDREVVSRTLQGSLHRYGYAQALKRVRRLARALKDLGVEPGDRVATLAWSTHRHFELYYAAAGIGAVLHTINPRLHPDQITWMIAHAEDAVVLFDTTFADLVTAIAPQLASVKSLVVMTDREHLPEGLPDGVLVFEELAAGAEPLEAWHAVDENDGCGLCYTSGTTGEPKGVLYSHRSTVLHALASALPDNFGLAASDVVMPCAQMYHANAWGTPYSAPLVGAKLVLPGRDLDGTSLVQLIEEEAVTFALGVPTIWLGTAEVLEAQARGSRQLRP